MCTHKANCGPPSLPVNVYILLYASTLEGTKVAYNICDTNMSLYKEITICTKLGQWEPNTNSICEEIRYSGTQYINLILYIPKIKLIGHHNQYRGLIKSRWKDCCGFFSNCLCCDFSSFLHRWFLTWTLPNPSKSEG